MVGGGGALDDLWSLKGLGAGGAEPIRWGGEEGHLMTCGPSRALMQGELSRSGGWGGRGAGLSQSGGWGEDGTGIVHMARA